MYNLDTFTPKLGLVLMFEGDLSTYGDYRRVIFGPLKRVTAFTSVSGVLMRGTEDVTTKYVTGAAAAVGNNAARTGFIGHGTHYITAGEYIYYLTGTYDSGKVTTWAVDVIVQPRDMSHWFMREMWKESYDPYIGDLTYYGSDKSSALVNIPGMSFSAVTGKLFQGPSDVTATYCSDVASPSGSTLNSAVIGGTAALVPGDYVYLLSATYGDGNIITYFWKVSNFPKYAPQ